MDRRSVNGQMNPAAQISQAEVERISALVAEVKEMATAMKKADRNNLKRARKLGEILLDFRQSFKEGKLAHRGRILRHGDWERFLADMGVSRSSASEYTTITRNWEEVKDCTSVAAALAVLHQSEDEEESSNVRSPNISDVPEEHSGEEEEEEVVEESRPKSANSSSGGRQKTSGQTARSKSRAKPEKSTAKGGGKASGKVSLRSLLLELRSRPKKEQEREVKELFDDDDLVLWLMGIWDRLKNG